MLVTMFTDAGLWRSKNLSSWAVWARTSGMSTLRRSGVFLRPVEQTGTAELGAIANGLVAVSCAFAPGKGSKIICQTDSQEAITAIIRRRHTRKHDTEILKYLLEFSETREWVLDVRHVKGHEGTATPRNAVNTWCDEECRRMLKQMEKV